MMVASTVYIRISSNNKIRFPYVPGRYMWSIGPMDQIMAFLLISRRYILNSELTKSHMDFSVLSLDLHPEKHGFRNQNIVSI